MKTILGMLLSFVLIVSLVSIQSIMPVSVRSQMITQGLEQNGEKLHPAENTIKLILETDKSVYVLGESITITLKNVGDEKVNVRGYPAWRIYTYPDEEPVYPKIIYYLSWSLEPGQSDIHVWNQYDDVKGEFCKPGIYVVKDMQGWNLSAYFVITAKPTLYTYLPYIAATVIAAVAAVGTIAILKRRKCAHAMRTRVHSLSPSFCKVLLINFKSASSVFCPRLR
jgi:hypothetical protein